MAGTLVISTLSDGTNSTSSTNCIQGSAKAWCRFTGSTAAINGSYNVSSITRNSTGYYTVNFTNAMTDTNYAMLGSQSSGSAASSVSVFMNSSGVNVAPTTTSAQFITQNNAGLYDSAYTSISVFR